MTDDYAPFPEAELTKLAEDWEGIASMLNEGGLKDSVARRAKTCRDALACHVALRERCLTAEMERDQLIHDATSGYA